MLIIHANISNRERSVMHSVYRPCSWPCRLHCTAPPGRPLLCRQPACRHSSAIPRWRQPGPPLARSFFSLTFRASS